MNESEQILIVDDDPGFRKTLADILQAKGYHTLSFAQGKTALKKTAAEKPSVALVDLRLSDISGLDVIKGIKKDSPETECIVLTGFASKDSAIDAVNMGAYSYLQKPYEIDYLLLTIQRAIEKRKTENALRESEEKYRLLFTTANEGILILDMKGVIQDVNSTFLQMCGLQRGELVGKGLLDLARIFKVDMKQILSKFRKFIAGEIFESDWSIHTKEKKKIDVRVFPSFITKEGKRTGISTIIMEVTEQKKGVVSFRL